MKSQSLATAWNELRVKKLPRPIELKKFPSLYTYSKDIAIMHL